MTWRLLAVKMTGVILFSVLMGCGSHQTDSMLTDKRNILGSAIDKVPRVEELYMSLPSDSNSITVPILPANSVTKTQMVEVNGECFFSTYPGHKIIALENGIQLDITDLQTTTDILGKYAICKNGRFSFALNGTNLVKGVHSIRLVLEAYDSNNAVVTNDVQGVAVVKITKPN